MKPIRIQRKRVKGFDLQAESMARNGLPCVYVGRPTKWGNPFRIGDFVTFPESGVAIYWITTREHATGTYWELKTPNDVLIAFRKYLSKSPVRVEEIQFYLHGKNLACWCAEDAPCHADTLLELANK